MTDESIIHFKTAKAGSKKLRSGTKPVPAPVPDRVPRISRLMALAIHFDGLIQNGVISDYADIARLGGVTRARVTQIMNLLNLAPEIQEKILFLSGSEKGRESLIERDLRSTSDKLFWKKKGITIEKTLPVI